MEGRDVIRQGLKWRLGNDSKVRIFNDAWLPGHRQGKVTSPVANGQADAMVSMLINHESMCWKEDKIDRLLYSRKQQPSRPFPLVC